MGRRVWSLTLPERLAQEATQNWSHGDVLTPRGLQQLERDIATVIRAALDEAAKVARAMYRRDCGEIADAIEALKWQA